MISRERALESIRWRRGVFAKLYDRFILVVAIAAIIPFIILAFFTLVIGYPLHLIRELVFSQEAK